MIEFSEVVSKYRQRKSELGPAHAKMAEVLRTYDGELIVPLPEMDREEQAAVANLLKQGVDQTAMRCASVMPSISYPALRPGIKKSENLARIRRSTTLGWHDKVAMNLKLRRRARFMLAYGLSPVVVKPRRVDDDRDQSRLLPWWEVRNPMGTFPAPSVDPDDLVPPDCIFAYKRGRAWLENRYPDQMRALRKNDTTTSFEVVEYVSGDEIVFGVVGDPENGNAGFGVSGGVDSTVLVRDQNKAECPLSVIPARITLGQVMGQFYEMIGMHRWQAKLMALSLIGTERSIFPDQYLVIPSGGTGAVNVVADGAKGIIGEVEGGSLVNNAPGVGPYAAQALSQLEYNQRAGSSVPSEFGGQAGTNVRTGKRGDSVLSAAVDFPIQEIQELLERSLEAEHRIAIKVAKAYERRPVSFHVPGVGAVEYSPEDFESAVNVVRYAYAGADANGLTIQVGQKLGLETLSHRTAMELDPLVKDVEHELDLITSEKVRAAFLSNLQTMAADPNSPITPLDWALFSELVVTNKLEPEAAFQQVHEAAQERQAEKAERDAQAAQSAAPVGPEGQPGVQGPASASPEGIPSIAAPSEGVGNLSSLMTQLRRPAMQLPNEQMAGV